MIYLYIGKNSVRLLCLSKTLLGQYNPSFFHKVHSNELIKNGVITGMDLVASAVKEAHTNAQPARITDKDVTLILPQEVFTFGRFSIPKDISETAIMPFIKDKVRAELQISIETEQADYFITQQERESMVLFYALKKDAFLEFQQIFKLLQLKLVKIVPETAAYYKLFEKTLRKDKKEKILYSAYRKEASYGYLFDSLGLVDNERYQFGDDIKPAIKKKIDALNKDDAKVNRLILSGSESKKIRQDLFTKDVGAWTNPLEKIIDNFYQDYLKLIISNAGGAFSVLDYDMCFGAFVFTQENKDFSLTKTNLSPAKSTRTVRRSVNLSFLKEIFNLKTIFIFLISFGLSFGLIFGFSNLDVSSLKFSMPNVDIPLQDKIQNKPTPQPTDKPTPTTEPTPAFKREDIKVKILNGSGVKGKASEIKTSLQDAGYTDVITGNADNFEYETSEVQIKTDKNEIFSFVKEDLKDFATLKKAGELDEEETADVVFIIGADIQ